MDPATINSFLDQFIQVIDSGFGLIQGDVAYVLNALIVISVTLAGAHWALAAEAPIAPFFRKVLFVGFFAFLINNWNALATAINQSGAMLGLRAGGSGLTLPDLHNPGRIAGIGTELFGRTAELGRGMNILSDFVPLVTILIAAFVIMFGFFILALQIFSALIAFKLGSLAAFVALPWGVFSGTAWVAERPLGWVVGSA
ncbi:MAG: type IV secretion system protein, partial [Alphaproteobacteria bacterium]|nr:type IV secretion system protein [Alphaproteobacteria bacterium]